MFLKRCGIFFLPSSNCLSFYPYAGTILDTAHYHRRSPSVRNAQSTIYDAGNNGMYIFGGYGNTSSGLNYLNDSWG